MLFLWVFGNNIEDRLGRVRFLPFYLLCGAVAGLSQALADPGSTVPLIGASGAIAGVLGAYLVLYPRVRVWTIVMPFFFLPFRIPAWLWLAIFFALQFLLLGDSATSGGGGVAYLAHIGGFVAGAALIKPFLVGREEPRPPAPAIGPLVLMRRPWREAAAAGAGAVGAGGLRAPSARGGDAGRDAGRAGDPLPGAAARWTCRTCSPAARAGCWCPADRELEARALLDPFAPIPPEQDV